MISSTQSSPSPEAKTSLMYTIKGFSAGSASADAASTMSPSSMRARATSVGAFSYSNAETTFPSASYSSTVSPSAESLKSVCGCSASARSLPEANSTRLSPDPSTAGGSCQAFS